MALGGQQNYCGRSSLTDSVYLPSTASGQLSQKATPLWGRPHMWSRGTFLIVSQVVGLLHQGRREICPYGAATWRGHAIGRVERGESILHCRVQKEIILRRRELHTRDTAWLIQVVHQMTYMIIPGGCPRSVELHTDELLQHSGGIGELNSFQMMVSGEILKRVFIM